MPSYYRRSAPPESRLREPISRYGTVYGTDRALEHHNRWVGQVAGFVESNRPKRDKVVGDSRLTRADLDRLAVKTVQTRATAARIEAAKLASRQAPPRPRLDAANTMREQAGAAFGLRPPVVNDRRPAASEVATRPEVNQPGRTRRPAAQAMPALVERELVGV